MLCAFGTLAALVIFAALMTYVASDPSFDKPTDSRKTCPTRQRPGRFDFLMFGVEVVTLLVLLAYTTINYRLYQTTQKQLEMTERPFVVPSRYVFNMCGNAPGVSLGNYGHRPARVESWSGQIVTPKRLPHGPPLTKKQPIKIVLPDAQGERIDFQNFETLQPGWSCYLSGLIEYQFLDHRYCTRFCRYVTPPDPTEHACDDPSTIVFEEDEGCDRYDTDLPRQGREG